MNLVPVSSINMTVSEGLQPSYLTPLWKPTIQAVRGFRKAQFMNLLNFCVVVQLPQRDEGSLRRKLWEH